MGCWGSQVFDDDKALDFLGSIVGPLVDKLHDSFKDSDTLNNRDCPPDVAASLACLRALAAGIRPVRTHLQRSEVDLWRQNFLSWFDRRGARAWQAPEDAAEYRKNVEQEFSQLIAVLNEWPKEEWDAIARSRDRRDGGSSGK